METKEPAIYIRDLCFGYEEREALHNVTLSIEELDFAVVVGPNGGGKSTLLKLMLGLLKPKYGEVRIFGETPEKIYGSIGYVPQSVAFDPAFPLSVMEVLMLGRIHSRSLGFFRRSDRECAREALAEVGLAGYESRPFAALSGGERQRVLIAQALTMRPRLMLMDEPCANLDTASADAVYELLKNLNRRMTVVMVSHNLGLVESFAKHIICVNRTADLHHISQVSVPDLAAGNWVRISHAQCPVAHGHAPAEENSPHRGACDCDCRHHH
ncbi:MAG: ABC transporter ATP-binding protein [Victivallales bacterium]|nr:ABC transporter ATP-binding protein [Victivallales bacterium]